MPTDYAPTYCPGMGGQIAPGWYAIRTVADYMRPRFGPFDTKSEAQAVARQANADPLDPECRHPDHYLTRRQVCGDVMAYHCTGCGGEVFKTLNPCPECGGRMLDAGTDEASGERYRQCSGECDRMERIDQFTNLDRED